MARAALGLGKRQVEGGLVNRRPVALLQEALDGLNAGDSPRARLLARLSLEFTFSDETKRTESLSQEAVTMARRLADPAALRTALDARWMAVWGPDGLDERTALAAEILRVARETGDREMELEGRANRAASSLEWGDIQAAQADIAAHAQLAEELPMAVHRWAATTMQALQALLDGSFGKPSGWPARPCPCNQGDPTSSSPTSTRWPCCGGSGGAWECCATIGRESWTGFPGPRSHGRGCRSPTPSSAAARTRAAGCGRWPNRFPSGLEMASGCLPWRWAPFCPRA
jgi:hypothetical protein